MHSALSETAVRKTALVVGILALVVGMLMAFEYGRAMSMLHAFSLGLLAIAVSIAFIGAEIYRVSGRNTAAMIATVAGVCFSIGEYGTHFGYTVGTRVADTQQTGVQNTKYAEAQKNRDREVANLDLWKSQLATLMEQNAWAATVKADGLRAQIEVAQKEIDLEAERGGCKSKCALRMKEKADLEAKVATVEQATDLSKRIEATQRVIDKKVEVADTTEFHSSKIVNQTAGFAQFATWSDEPSDSALSWTQLVLGAIIAAITTYLAPFCLSIAYSGIRPAPRQSQPAAPEADLRTSAPVGGYGSVPSVQGGALQPSPSRGETNTYIKLEDGVAVEMLRALGRQVKERRGQLAEAV
jgi:hypothetical protein